MSNVIHIRPCADVVQGLRNIADDIESGAFSCDNITLIMNSEISQLGQFNPDRAAEKAVFDMVYGLSKMMHWVHRELDEQAS